MTSVPSSENRHDVVCVGIIVADNVCAPIAQLPVAGALITTPALTLSIGGCAANVGVDLAKLDASVAIIGRVGDDVFGQYVREELEKNGVDCQYCSVSQTSQTSSTMVVNVKGEDRRFIHAVGANAELTGLEVPDELLAKTRILYVGGFGLNAALSGQNVASLFQKAQKLGVKTILDVVLDDPQVALKMLEEALPFTDAFLPNTDEARLMTGIDDPLEQAEFFSKAGAKTVVITQGPDGVVVKDRDEGTYRVPGHRVEQVDGTGGGDAFVAGYVYGLLKEKSLQDCVSYGSALGASCVRAPGATTGVFNAVELEEYFAAHPLEAQKV